MQRPRDVEQRVDDVRRLEAVAHQFNNFVYILLRGVFSRVVVGRLGYRLPEGQDVAKRVPVQRRWGVDGCVVVARLWRKEAREEAVARRGATLLAENAEHEQAPTIAVDVGPPPARGLDVREEGTRGRSQSGDLDSRVPVPVLRA